MAAVAAPTDGASAQSVEGLSGDLRTWWNVCGSARVSRRLEQRRRSRHERLWALAGADDTTRIQGLVDPGSAHVPGASAAVVSETTLDSSLRARLGSPARPCPSGAASRWSSPAGARTLTSRAYEPLGPIAMDRYGSARNPRARRNLLPIATLGKWR